MGQLCYLSPLWREARVDALHVSPFCLGLLYQAKLCEGLDGFVDLVLGRVLGLHVLDEAFPVKVGANFKPWDKTANTQRKRGQIKHALSQKKPQKRGF